MSYINSMPASLSTSSSSISTSDDSGHQTCLMEQSDAVALRGLALRLRKEFGPILIGTQHSNAGPLSCRANYSASSVPGVQIHLARNGKSEGISPRRLRLAKVPLKLDRGSQR